MAGVASNVPGLIWISEHKVGVFVFAGLMLGMNGLFLWKNRNAPCPIDPGLRDACLAGRRNGKAVYFVSLAVFATGFFFAYVAPKLL